MVRRQALVTGQGSTPSGPTLIGIVFFVFSSGLSQKAADTLCCLSCALSCMALQALSGMVLTAGQWLESWALEHGQLLFFMHLLGNLAPLLRWLAAI